MPTDDPIIKTSFRLPKSVHAELERAASKAGLTVNGEAVYRLQNDPRKNTAKAVVFDEIEARDASILDGLRRQIATLWKALDRADVTLEHVAAAMTQVPPDGSAAVLKRKVEFARELINMIDAQR